MRNKKTYYIISAFLWLLVGFVCYQLYSFQVSKEKTEQNIFVSINETHYLYNTAFDKLELWKRRANIREIEREYTHPRGRILLDTIAMIKTIIDSLETEKTIRFTNVEPYFNKSYYHENNDLEDLQPIIKNENFYKKSKLYNSLYKNVLLKTIKKGNIDRYERMGSICGFHSTPKLQLFEKNKIGLGFDESAFNISYTNYPKTKSTNFEFETVVEKLGRNPQKIRTRYKTTPKGEKLGAYDYEKIETIVEK